MLSFNPNKFFNEMEKKDKIKTTTSRSAYYRAIKSGLVEIDESGHPRLTDKGKRHVKPYKPKKLGKGAHLLVVFDVPEDRRVDRNHLRTLLHELSFKKVQQSVWASPYDHREYLAAEIKEYGLEKCVSVYEALEVTPK